MKVKLALAMLCGILAVLAVGCATTSTPVNEAEADQQASPGIPIAPDFRINDIPVPAGFELTREQSFVFQNPSFDVGQLKYVGKEPITSVAQFYIDEMPRYGWKLLNVADAETVTLSYDKPEKSAAVLLMPKGHGTIIQISFFPKSETSASPSQ